MIVDSLSGLTGSIGDAIDNVVTSDEERLSLKNELQTLLNNHESSLLSAEASFRHEATEFAKSDMASDSVLSKNIRPVTVIWLMFFNTAALIAFLFGVSLPDQFLILLTILDPIVFGFYFGSRGMEKINLIRGKING